MTTNLPSCFSIQFLEQLLKFLANFTLLKYVTSQRNYGFLITKELIFGFQILDLKDHFLASLKRSIYEANCGLKYHQLLGNYRVHFLSRLYSYIITVCCLQSEHVLVLTCICPEVSVCFSITENTTCKQVITDID